MESAAERRIDLDPVDWFRAPWRELEPLARPAPARFDRAKALSRLSRARPAKNGETVAWDRMGIANALDAEGSRFWLRVMLDVSRSRRLAEVVEELQREPEQETNLQQVKDLLREAVHPLAAQFWVPLVRSLGPVEAAGAVLEDAMARPSAPYRTSPYDLRLGTGFREYVRPYLTAEETGCLRQTVRELGEWDAWAAAPRTAPRFLVSLASALGMEAELRILLTAWTSGTPFQPEYWKDRLQDALFGLGDPDFVESEMRRLRLRVDDVPLIRGWLAHTEWRALDWVAESIRSASRRDWARALQRELARVHAPEAAPAMLDLMLHSRAPEVARQWLDAHPRECAAGLVSMAAGRGKLATAALERLRLIHDQGESASVSEALGQLTGSAARKLGALLEGPGASSPELPSELPPWLAGLIDRERAAGSSADGLGTLPVLHVDGRALPEDAVRRILDLLQGGSPPSQQVIALLKQHCEAGALDRFGERLCLSWLENGGRLDRLGLLAAAARLGGDRTAHALGQIAGRCRGHGRHRAAAAALESLPLNESETALWVLRQWAYPRTRRTRTGAAAAILDRLAQQRGLTPEQMDDQCIPRLGLDSGGRRPLRFGTRSFTVEVDPSLDPRLRDERGRVLRTLPVPTTGSDPAETERARQEWKELCSTLEAVRRLEAVRLESAMLSERGWAPEDWMECFLSHPVLGLLARGIVWACFDGRGTRTVFRIAEDRTLADLVERTVHLSTSARIVIPHPACLTERECEGWRDRLLDYGLVQPFPQLSRPVRRLSPEDRSLREVPEVREMRVDSGKLDTLLRTEGWTATPLPGFRGRLYRMTLLDTTAMLQVEDGSTPGAAGATRVGSLRFVAGPEPSQDLDSAPPLPLGEVPPIALSEAVTSVVAASRLFGVG